MKVSIGKRGTLIKRYRLRRYCTDNDSVDFYDSPDFIIFWEMPTFFQGMGKDKIRRIIKIKRIIVRFEI